MLQENSCRMRSRPGFFAEFDDDCAHAYIAGRTPCELKREVALYNSGAVNLCCGRGVRCTSTGLNAESALSINQYRCASLIAVCKPIGVRRDRGIMPTGMYSRETLRDYHVSATEVEKAIKRMKPGIATGPDDIASELWKTKSCDPIPWLIEFFNWFVLESRTPSDWQESTTVPI